MVSTAERLAKKQKEISVSEFFEKNRHILGFDSLSKSLIMGVKEATDNSLDACEEAGVLPEVYVGIDRTGKEDFRVTILDNGPGIVKKNLPNVFGRLLYGSRFHSLRQSRGQQGIGISATVMYGQMTTGRPAIGASKIEGSDTGWSMEISVDTKRNRPNTRNEQAVIWESFIAEQGLTMMWTEYDHGTFISYTTKGRYITGKQSIYEYLRQTAIVNPHARITFVDIENKVTIFERATTEMPPVAKEIKPHPTGIELGVLMSMAKTTKARQLSAFLKQDFSRISDRVANEICETGGLNINKKPQSLSLEEYKSLLDAIDTVKIMAPQTDCLSPIGEALIRKGLRHVLNEMRPDYYAPPVSRSPKVTSGNPFIVEAGIVYGGDLPKDQQVQILRFGNRVPLLYQQGACVITKAIEGINWRQYGLEQRGGRGIPYGPAIIMVHVASTKVPFTSEAKEAIANLEVMRQEVDLALRGCARNLKRHLNKQEKRKKTRVKFEIVQEILPQIAIKSAAILERDVPDISGTITKIMNVIWIDASAERTKKGLRVTVRVFNYTNKKQTFKLHTLFPREALDESIISDHIADVEDDGRITWEIKKLPKTNSVEISFDLKELGASDFDENDIYVSGVNPALVMGADQLPGDWGIKAMDITEVEEEDDDDELDYDENGGTIDDEE